MLSAAGPAVSHQALPFSSRLSARARVRAVTARAATSTGTQSASAAPSAGRKGSCPLMIPAHIWCQPWNWVIAPVTESPISTEGRTIAYGSPLVTTACSAAILDRR